MSCLSSIFGTPSFRFPLRSRGNQRAFRFPSLREGNQAGGQNIQIITRGEALIGSKQARFLLRSE